jgi:hypothetical protein
MFFASRIAPGARANLRMNDRLQQLHSIFFAGDTDRSGDLGLDEFVAGIRPIVGPLDGAEQQFLFDAFDFSRDRRINLAEFDYALWRDVQATGDAADVRAALAGLLQRKLEAFRALAPGERGNRGSKVDDNVVDLRQKEVKFEQRRGQGLVAALGRVLGSKAGLLSVLGLVGIAAGIAVALVTRNNQAFFLALAGYATFLFASFMGHDFALLSNAVAGAAGLAARFEPAYRANAKFRWHIECYHNERRTTTDSKGHRHTHTVRVTTYTATHEGALRSFELSAPFVPDENSFVLTQVISRARVQIRFPGYFQARDSWRAANTRDAHQDFSATESIPGMAEEVLVEYVPGARPWWMTRWAFVLWTLLLSSLCFKVAFNARCGRQEYTFVKDAIDFAEDPVCEEARAYDEEKKAGLGNAVYVQAAPQVVVVVPVVAAAVPLPPFQPSSLSPQPVPA